MIWHLLATINGAHVLIVATAALWLCLRRTS